VHFANKDPSIEVKKLAVLNEKQFVCSNYLTDRERKQATRGRIKVYNLEEEFEVMTTVLPEGAYGLSVIDKYLLVGNLEGSVSFWNASQGPFSSEHPFEITQKLHEGYIFELLKNGASPGGFSVVTLGIDFQIKLFEVSEDLITDDIVTLFFREDASFSQGREIMSIDLMEERTRLVAGSYNKIITYDLPTRKVAGESVQRSNIYRLKRMRESLVAVANTSNLSFADPRANGAVACCPLSQEVKALCVVNENVACYGTSDGELGMVDLRRPVAPYWRDQGTHNSRIYDILRMGDRLVSGDQKGLLVGWNSAEMK
jgi:WD40 repeat protein